MENRFKFIKKFEKYSACTNGHIYSNDYNHTGKRKILKECIDKDGYPYIRMVINGKRYKRMVHRLIAETFADVKQLTKELIEKIKLNKDVWKINIQEHFIDIQKMYVTYRVRFTDIGNILFDSYLKIAENKTDAEMWAIIKSLIGEK